MENLNFNYNYKIPNLLKEIKLKYFNKAINSKKRYRLIIHEHGAEFNQVFSFICIDSYMSPHFTHLIIW
jgi:hypothetical protein